MSNTCQTPGDESRVLGLLGPRQIAFGAAWWLLQLCLRHYCVHLRGPDLHSALPDFAADVDAARALNGDIAQYVQRWRTELAEGSDPALLGRQIARRSLLVVAGLVSIHDHVWTTDRAAAVARWAEIEPTLADDLRTLLEWSRGGKMPDRQAVQAELDGVVDRVVASFKIEVGFLE